MQKIEREQEGISDLIVECLNRIKRCSRKKRIETVTMMLEYS